MKLEPSARTLHLLKPPVLAGVTLLGGEGLRQRFSRHTHEEYAVGVVTSGVLGFQYLGSTHLAGQGEINLVVPDEAHTGHPALGEHWSYRMFYVEPQCVRDVAAQIGQPSGGLPFFAAGVLRDPHLANRILSLHVDICGQQLSPLETESRWMSLLVNWLQRHAEQCRNSIPVFRHVRAAERVREIIEDEWERKPTLRELSRAVQLSPFQILRAFARRYGMPPHAYLVQRQLREAKSLLDRGYSVAATACGAGFADQSHLHRHFKRAWGMTPGEYCNFVQESKRRPH